MPASYPNSNYSPRAKENKSGVVYDADKTTVLFVEDISKLDEEVVAIETELKAPVTREYADNVAAVTGGLVNGQLYRTADVLKIVHS